MAVVKKNILKNTFQHAHIKYVKKYCQPRFRENFTENIIFCQKVEEEIEKIGKIFCRYFFTYGILHFWGVCVYIFRPLRKL